MSQHSPVFAIEGEFSIYRATELATAMQTWMARLQPGEQVAVDLANVTEIDGAGLQLLLSLQHTTGLQSLEFCITDASAAVQEVLVLSGLAHWLPSISMP